MNGIELKELAGGALQEQFEKSFERVIENLQNPNTPFKNSREISIKLKFTQNEQRDDVRCAILVTEKLAPWAPTETAFSVGKNLRTGELYAEEYGKQIKGQLSIQTEEKRIEGGVVDMETGEVTPDEKPSNVLDFRKMNS